jgi:hypothetical protein
MTDHALAGVDPNEWHVPEIPVAISTALSTVGGPNGPVTFDRTLVVCRSGRVFYLRPDTLRPGTFVWDELPPVPDSEAAPVAPNVSLVPARPSVS